MQIMKNILGPAILLMATSVGFAREPKTFTQTSPSSVTNVAFARESWVGSSPEGLHCYRVCGAYGRCWYVCN
jgi:hypothetical protein